VKRLHVYPGASLSLQSHQHRSEHWVVVSGTASVVRDDEILTLATNESVYIHVGQKHRLANETQAPLTVIEVQTGDYLGEDDIVRYEDYYSRL
jgi:mannose-6-phosphate isomerase-like protein (cupin superfamily)